MTPSPTTDQILVQLPTHDPQEVVIRLAISTRDLKPEKRPAKGTAYKDLSLASAQKPEVHRWGDYRLLEVEEGPAPYHHFFFGKPKDEEAKWTPVDSWEDYETETWPPVLVGLRLVIDRGAPVSLQRPSTTATSKREVAFINPQIPFVQLIPQTTALCQVKWERFQSDTPFEGLNYPRPVPGNVSWNFGAAGSGSFTALHPDIIIRRPPGQYATVADATPGTVDAPFRRDLYFPATRFKRWRPFVFAVKPSRVNSLYVLDRATIYPPPPPKIISQCRTSPKPKAPGVCQLVH